MENRYLGQFKKGSLEMILLCLISRGETYGYEIISALGANEVLGAAKEGTVYPILYRLEQAGLVESRIARAASGRGERKYYSLTREGRETLRELAAFWRQFSTCVDKFVEEAKF